MLVVMHFPGRGQSSFFSADAGVLILVRCMVGYFVVVCFDHGLHVVHAAVTYFQGVSVADLVEHVVLGEVSINKGEKFCSDIGCHVVAVWWIEPCYFPFPMLLFLFGGGGFLGLVCQLDFVSGIL